MDIWFASDHHFNHANIIRYCERPFASVHEMNETLIENHNAVVKQGDRVYFLGDVYMGDKPDHIPSILARLKGTKRLILGNHDVGKDQWLLAAFGKISMWRYLKEFGLLVTHVPVHPNCLNDKTPINVHGHLHEKCVTRSEREPVLGLDTGRYKADERYINVSVERTNYAPVNLETLRIR